MTEFLSQLSSLERMTLLILVLVLVFLAIQAVRHGLISFKGKGLRIGRSESSASSKRMKIIKAQIDHLNTKSQYYVLTIIKMTPVELDEWYVKYFVEHIKNVIIEWLIFEKVGIDKNYIEMKTKFMITTVKNLIPTNSISAINVISSIVERQIEDLFKEFVGIEKGMK